MIYRLRLDYPNPSGPAKYYRDATGILNKMFPTDFEQYFSPARREADRGNHKPYYQYLDPKTGKVVTKY